MYSIQAFLFLMKYIFLGIVQGVTEPIPISSSGHLILLRRLLDIQITGLSFEVIVNTGSLLAILIIYCTVLSRLFRTSSNYVRQRDSLQRVDFLFVLYLSFVNIAASVIAFLFA